MQRGDQTTPDQTSSGVGHGPTPIPSASNSRALGIRILRWFWRVEVKCNESRKSPGERTGGAGGRSRRGRPEGVVDEARGAVERVKWCRKWRKGKWIGPCRTCDTLTQKEGVDPRANRSRGNDTGAVSEEALANSFRLQAQMRSKFITHLIDPGAAIDVNRLITVDT